LSPGTGAEVVTIGRTVNAFFRWEFNSCETLVRGEDVFPIDYANACPDVALTSLHYYFPWAMKALVRWSAYCTVTGRRARMFVEPDPWFAVADDPDRSYGDKLAAYGRLADDHFEAERYAEFCATQLGGFDEATLEFVESPGFDRLLVDTVRSTFPPHEHDHFVGHYRGLLAAWARDERIRLG
jgi:hypothetical protein